VIGPFELGGVDDGGGAVNALRLIPGARIGIRAVPIEEVHVEVAGPDGIEGAAERTVS
jgi:hypothetical protein